MKKIDNSLYRGTIEIGPDNFAVIKNESFYDKNVYVKEKYINGAFDRDIVEFNIIRDQESVQLKGRVLNIIKRFKNKFIGLIIKNNNKCFVKIESYQSKKIILKGNIDYLSEQDVVEILITDWGKGRSVAYAKLVRIISKGFKKDSDYLFIINKYGIIKDEDNIKGHSFFKKIISREIKHRINLENILTFTIDPSSAKDFDDAISIEEIANGYRLYIHIADVSEFVEEGSKVDKIAMYQGNSYYFQESVIHMLPKILSEKFCSLKQNKLRLAVSVIFDIDFEGNVLNAKINETCIKVDKKFSYQEVDEILRKKENTKITNQLISLDKISKVLMKKRLENGGFEIAPTKIKYDIDNKGRITNVKDEERFQSHRIIEECMLLTNKSIANIFGDKVKIFRNHNKPSQYGERIIRNLISDSGLFSNRYEYQLDTGIHKLIKSFNSNIKRKVFSLLILKKLKKASYNTFSHGHFGLGFQKYTHFTSPIRRYPDLLVHRFIKDCIRGKERLVTPMEDKAVELANKAENNSKKAQNEYLRIKGLRWLSDNSQTILDGFFLEFQKGKVIIGIGNSIEIQGVISIDKFPRDQYKALSNNMGIKGKEKSNFFKVGDKCKVQIEEVDFESMIAHLSFVSL